MNQTTRRQTPSTWGRPVRFVLVGAFCALLQLVLLAVLVEATPLGLSGNAVAFVLSAQVNFLLSDRLTWSDRRARRVARLRRLLAFNLLIGVSAGINQALFLLAAAILPYLVASAVALVATSALKYAIADRRIFRLTPDAVG